MKKILMVGLILLGLNISLFADSTATGAVIRKATISGAIFQSWKEKDDQGNYKEKYKKICNFENNDVSVLDNTINGPEVSYKNTITCESILKSGKKVYVTVFSLILLDMFPDFAKIPVGQIYNNEDDLPSNFKYKQFWATFNVLEDQTASGSTEAKILQEAQSNNFSKDLNLKSVEMFLFTNKTTETEDDFSVMVKIEDSI